MTTTSNKKQNIFAKTALAAAIVGLVSMPVAAKKYRNYAEQSNSSYDYARVVGVDPIVESYQVNQPVEQCWDERVERRYDRPRHRSSSYTGEIFGAIIGGALGTKFGSGRGKKVATAAGAVLGASVARDIKRSKHEKKHARYDNRYDRVGRYEVQQRCELVDNYVTEKQVVAYNVAYKYRGNVFHTEMDQAPGEKIKVLVTVNPV